MAKSVRIQLNKAGVRQLARSKEMQDILNERAQLIANAAGEGFRVTGGPSRNRARAVVVSASAKAILAERKTRALTRAIDAGKAR